MITENILTEARSYFNSYYLKHKSDDMNVQRSIDLKKNHTLRVVENTGKLAGALSLNDEQKVIAEVIALYHDAGRFLQFTKYGTFNDEQSEDHALLSVAAVTEAPFFAGLDEISQQIIKMAIQNHSKIQLPNLEDEQMQLFCQLIRDADKLDLWAMIINQFRDRSNDDMKVIMYNLPDLNPVSEKVVKAIQIGKLVKKEDMKTMNDFRLMVMSWVFDLNFRASFNILNQHRYIEKVYDTLPKQDGIINAYRTIKLFIENKFVE
ncbi:MAG: hypothetical protein A2W90_21565 [Bacteroidetes bacterium GWF2_42_66]|nr:MAG: hypothetical protein A2W92_04380 [Bacteroidetes bacterium GWA2_42_15]OFY03314.1 MAG: hypothetical protein A2W89_19295 [Bacteroidetes bacterium GWE2_42_39]OFY45636.1 MAG: hypothetical protein A2W90_21565 [Bacteroidetes bacterium GWF2_42_66]HBL77384.1 hypothetical protein [Prolixibacteraceae bacterium]HCU62542.1 hypothetical protein [Prolixibacteraceae bacterium]